MYKMISHMVITTIFISLQCYAWISMTLALQLEHHDIGTLLNVLLWYHVPAVRGRVLMPEDTVYKPCLMCWLPCLL